MAPRLRQRRTAEVKSEKKRWNMVQNHHHCANSAPTIEHSNLFILVVAVTARIIETRFHYEGGAANDRLWLCRYQAIFDAIARQPSRPPPGNLRPRSPASATGPVTAPPGRRPPSKQGLRTYTGSEKPKRALVGRIARARGVMVSASLMLPPLQ